MFSILIWCVYGILVGAIAKAIVPGEENFGFLKTIALGIAGSYAGGILCYMLGKYSEIQPSGLFMGVVGAVIALLVHNKLIKN
jgi:uncharacterized membrane protein YeaQ/YmgE (transglycosylase-associated protein family)